MTDWAADVKADIPQADDRAIAGIVTYCGIALRNRDSSFVAFSDSAELARVRDNFLKKKLGLAKSDAELDEAIAEVGAKLKGAPSKHRVTVYYMLADKYGKLPLFSS